MQKKLMQECLLDALSLQKDVGALVDKQDVLNGRITRPRGSMETVNIAIELFRARLGLYSHSYLSTMSVSKGAAPYLLHGGTQ